MKLTELGDISDLLGILNANYNASESELEDAVSHIDKALENLRKDGSNFQAHWLSFDDCLKVYGPAAWEAYIESEEHLELVDDAGEDAVHIDIENILHELIHSEYCLNETAFFVGGKEIKIIIVTDIADSTNYYYKIEYEYEL